jgi:hypothetical protein
MKLLRLPLLYNKTLHEPSTLIKKYKKHFTQQKKGENKQQGLDESSPYIVPLAPECR